MSEAALIEAPDSATVVDPTKAWVPSHGNGLLSPFRKGVSPNPGGRGKPYFEALAIAKQHGPDAMRKLIELMGSDDDRVALIAANSILDRALGKPKETKEETTAFRPVLASLSPEKLAALRQIMGDLATTSPSVEAAPIPSDGPDSTLSP